MILALFGDGELAKFCRDAVGEIYDPSVSPWTDLPFGSDLLKRQRQEDIYDWDPGTGIDGGVFRLVLATRLADRRPEKANRLIRRMVAGPYGNLENIAEASDELFRRTGPGRLCLLATCAGLLMLFNFLFNSPNHTSIHGFYRDRLRDAFIVKPTDPAIDDEPKVRSRSRVKLSDLLSKNGDVSGPYPLICASLNLQGSSDDSIRDRNAESFLFSPLWIGNKRVSFASSAVMEEFDTDLTADAAMAISAAAAAPNMGKYTVSWVSFLIVLLNVRLGRWIPHPRSLQSSDAETSPVPTETFATVADQEWSCIKQRRKNADLAPRVSAETSEDEVGQEMPIVEGTQRHLFGLALSGGGIRSASVSLGLTQALDQFGLFKEVDYLSSVSGGGYTATAISTFMQTCLSPDVQVSEMVGTMSPSKRWNYLPPSRYLLREMTGCIRESLPWIYVSDGGHFENTAAYELLKRRCELIIVSDGEEDADGKFPGLSNLIRLAEIDLNTMIEFRAGSLEQTVIEDREDDRRYSESNFAIAKVLYPAIDSDGPATGWLLYVRSSLLEHEDAVLRNLAKSDAKFPHQTTADQSFDELQFEAYRRLGETMMTRTLRSVSDSSGPISYDQLRHGLLTFYQRQGEST